MNGLHRYSNCCWLYFLFPCCRTSNFSFGYVDVHQEQDSGSMRHKNGHGMPNNRSICHICLSHKHKCMYVSICRMQVRSNILFCVRHKYNCALHNYSRCFLENSLYKGNLSAQILFRPHQSRYDRVLYFPHRFHLGK